MVMLGQVTWSEIHSHTEAMRWTAYDNLPRDQQASSLKVMMILFMIVIFVVMILLTSMTMTTILRRWMTLCFLLVEGLPGESGLKDEENGAPALCHPQRQEDVILRRCSTSPSLLTSWSRCSPTRCHPPTLLSSIIHRLFLSKRFL